MPGVLSSTMSDCERSGGQGVWGGLSAGGPRLSTAMTARGGMRPHTAQRQAEHPGLTHQPQGCCSMVSRRQRKPTQASRSSHRQAPPGPHLHEARPSPVEPVSALVCRRRRVHPAVTAVGHQAPDAGVPQEARDIPHRVPRQAERASPQRQRPPLPPPPPALPDPTGSALKRNPAETGAQPKASRGRRESASVPRLTSAVTSSLKRALRAALITTKLLFQS